MEFGPPPKSLELRFRGIALGATEVPHKAALGDYPSARAQPEEAEDGVDRLSSLGKILGYLKGKQPEDLQAFPQLLIAKTEKVRMAHD